MKIISAIITVIVISAILENFLPWWVIAPVSFGVTYLFRLKWYQAFVAGFAGMFILLAGMALFIDNSNEHILSNRVSVLFFKSIKPFAVVIMTGLIGGLVAGFAGMADGLLGKK